MNAATYPVDTNQQANVSGTTLAIRPDSAAANTAADRLLQDAPAAIPASQMYYWARAWQQGERQALEEVERGEGRYFDTPGDAVRWLLDPEG